MARRLMVTLKQPYAPNYASYGLMRMSNDTTYTKTFDAVWRVSSEDGFVKVYDDQGRELAGYHYDTVVSYEFVKEEGK